MVPAPIGGWIRSSVERSRLLYAAERRKLRHTFLGLGENIESLYIDNFYSALGAFVNLAIQISEISLRRRGAIPNRLQCAERLDNGAIAMKSMVTEGS